MTLRNTVEAVVHLERFQNVDLFYQGYYFVRFSLYYELPRANLRVYAQPVQHHETFSEANFKLPVTNNKQLHSEIATSEKSNSTNDPCKIGPQIGSNEPLQARSKIPTEFSMSLLSQTTPLSVDIAQTSKENFTGARESNSQKKAHFSAISEDTQKINNIGLEVNHGNQNQKNGVSKTNDELAHRRPFVKQGDTKKDSFRNQNVFRTGLSAYNAITSTITSSNHNNLHLQRQQNVAKDSKASFRIASLSQRVESIPDEGAAAATTSDLASNLSTHSKFGAKNDSSLLPPSGTTKGKGLNSGSRLNKTFANYNTVHSMSNLNRTHSEALLQFSPHGNLANQKMNAFRSRYLQKQAKNKVVSSGQSKSKKIVPHKLRPAEIFERTQEYQSRVFYIRSSDEKVTLNEVVHFCCETEFTDSQANSNQPTSNEEKPNFYMEANLYFLEATPSEIKNQTSIRSLNGKFDLAFFQKVSTCTMKMEQVPNQACFEYFPAQFENSYRSFLDIQIFSIKHNVKLNSQNGGLFRSLDSKLIRKGQIKEKEKEKKILEGQEWVHSDVCKLMVEAIQPDEHVSLSQTCHKNRIVEKLQKQIQMQKGVGDRVTLDQVSYLDLILLAPHVQILGKTRKLKNQICEQLKKEEPEKFQIMETDGLIWHENENRNQQQIQEPDSAKICNNQHNDVLLSVSLSTYLDSSQNKISNDTKQEASSSYYLNNDNNNDNTSLLTSSQMSQKLISENRDDAKSSKFLQIQSNSLLSKFKSNDNMNISYEREKIVGKVKIGSPEHQEQTKYQIQSQQSSKFSTSITAKSDKLTSLNQQLPKMQEISNEIMLPKTPSRLKKPSLNFKRQTNQFEQQSVNFEKEEQTMQTVKQQQQPVNVFEIGDSDSPFGGPQSKLRQNNLQNTNSNNNDDVQIECSNQSQMRQICKQKHPNLFLPKTSQRVKPKLNRNTTSIVSSASRPFDSNIQEIPPHQTNQNSCLNLSNLICRYGKKSSTRQRILPLENNSIDLSSFDASAAQSNGQTNASGFSLAIGDSISSIQRNEDLGELSKKNKKQQQVKPNQHVFPTMSGESLKREDESENTATTSQNNQASKKQQHFKERWHPVSQKQLRMRTETQNTEDKQFKGDLNRIAGNKSGPTQKGVKVNQSVVDLKKSRSRSPLDNIQSKQNGVLQGPPQQYDNQIDNLDQFGKDHSLTSNLMRLLHSQGSSPLNQQNQVETRIVNQKACRKFNNVFQPQFENQGQIKRNNLRQETIKTVKIDISKTGFISKTQITSPNKTIKSSVERQEHKYFTKEGPQRPRQFVDFPQISPTKASPIGFKGSKERIIGKEQQGNKKYFTLHKSIMPPRASLIETSIHDQDDYNDENIDDDDVNDTLGGAFSQIGDVSNQSVRYLVKKNPFHVDKVFKPGTKSHRKPYTQRPHLENPQRLIPQGNDSCDPKVRCDEDFKDGNRSKSPSVLKTKSVFKNALELQGKKPYSVVKDEFAKKETKFYQTKQVVKVLQEKLDFFEIQIQREWQTILSILFLCPCVVRNFLRVKFENQQAEQYSLMVIEQAPQIFTPLNQIQPALNYQLLPSAQNIDQQDEQLGQIQDKLVLDSWVVLDDDDQLDQQVEKKPHPTSQLRNKIGSLTEQFTTTNHQQEFGPGGQHSISNRSQFERNSPPRQRSQSNMAETTYEYQNRKQRSQNQLLLAIDDEEPTYTPNRTRVVQKMNHTKISTSNFQSKSGLVPHPPNHLLKKNSERHLRFMKVKSGENLLQKQRNEDKKGSKEKEGVGERQSRHRDFSCSNLVSKPLSPKQIERSIRLANSRRENASRVRGSTMINQHQQNYHTQTQTTKLEEEKSQHMLLKGKEGQQLLQERDQDDRNVFGGAMSRFKTLDNRYGTTYDQLDKIQASSSQMQQIGDLTALHHGELSSNVAEINNHVRQSFKARQKVYQQQNVGGSFREGKPDTETHLFNQIQPPIEIVRKKGKMVQDFQPIIIEEVFIQQQTQLMGGGVKHNSSEFVDKQMKESNILQPIALEKPGSPFPMPRNKAPNYVRLLSKKSSSQNSSKLVKETKGAKNQHKQVQNSNSNINYDDIYDVSGLSGDESCDFFSENLSEKGLNQGYQESKAASKDISKKQKSLKFVSNLLNNGQPVNSKKDSTNKNLKQPAIQKQTKNLEVHLFVFVHGFQACSTDMRQLKNHLQVLLPDAMFLVSQANEKNTDARIEDLGRRLAGEVHEFIFTYLSGYREVQGQKKQICLGKLSFVGHSLGGIIVRESLKHLRSYQSKMHGYVSLGSPHLSYMYNSNSLVSAGMWFIKNFQRSTSIQQLSMTDATEKEKCYLYKLSEDGGLSHFKYVVLVSSFQDSYAPPDSARIQMCSQAAKEEDLKRSQIYMQMVENILGRLKCAKLFRLDVNFNIPKKDYSLATLIGRTAHILMIECDPFLLALIYRYRDVFCP